MHFGLGNINPKSYLSASAAKKVLEETPQRLGDTEEYILV
jgi:hypothetical protein